MVRVIKHHKTADSSDWTDWKKAILLSGCVLVCLGMATLIGLVTVEVVDLSAGAGIFASYLHHYLQ